MEKLRSYKNLKAEERNNSRNKEEIKEVRNIRYPKKYYNQKRRLNNKDKIPSKKNIRTSENSQNKNRSRRKYTKRTDLIQERIKILQFARKNIDEEVEDNDNKKSETNNKLYLTINKKDSKDLNEIFISEKDNILYQSIKLEDKNKIGNLKLNLAESNNKYIKKYPSKNMETSVEKGTAIKKYQTSTFIYKNDSNENKTIDKDKEKYSNNTYNIEKIQNNRKEIKDKMKDMDLIGYKTGFVYTNKKKKIDYPETERKHRNNINSYVFIKTNSNKNNYKTNNNSLTQSKNNLKEVIVDYDNSIKEILNNKDKDKDLKNIYIPKKVHHPLIRGSSQENINNIKRHNFVNTNNNSNINTKNRFKSYNKVDNYKNKNNINININNNIKIIAYNKKVPQWKLDNKDNDIDLIEQKLDEQKLDIFKDNISDISSIESRSYIESETTENNNKLNVYLNNIYKTKSVFQPNLNKKKQNEIKVEKESSPIKYSLNSYKINNEMKNTRNVSVPHFIFKKRITKEKCEYNNNKSNLNTINNKNSVKNLKALNNNIKNSVKNIKNVNNKSNDNEIKFYELVILEEKLKNIIDGIDRNSSIISNLCFDYLNNFYESSFLTLIEKLFQNKNLKIINSYLKYLVFSILILYDYCIYSEIEENDKFLIQEIFSLNFENIFHLYEYIISKVKSKNVWANILKNIIHAYKRQKRKTYSSSTNVNYQSIFDKIKNNTKYIRQIINRVFSNNKNTTEKIMPFFKELENKTFIEIKTFFDQNIYQQNKIYGYIFPSILENDLNKEKTQEKISFIKKDKMKKFTLFLGLEDILVNLKIEDESDSKGTLKLRPGIIPFLREIQKYYEIFVFSLSENEIADHLINSIDKRKKFFDYRLYRENLNIINDQFVIDLSKFNRPLEKSIIISNLPQIYQLQKENSINIKSYYKEDLNDNILKKLLSILKNIVEEEGDISEILLKYRDDIIKYVTIGYFQY